MRNFNVITNGLEEESPENDVKCVYKEVVVVGNGPSGITLSYLLNGHRPYYNKIPHPDPMLSARLIECTQKSLLHQDLSFLSQGIEGRSKNPISLLIDAMTHPGADMGLEWPSLLTWKKTAKSLDHVVLGRGDPGGTWLAVADHILSISPGRWMALPGLEFKEYHDKRAPAFAVAKYYMDYVIKHDLTQYMASHSTVTMIQPITSKLRKRARWKVWVTDANGGTISYECRHLVLATGSSDKAGCLDVPGESLPFITHNLRHFEEQLSRSDLNTSNGRHVSPSRVNRTSDCGYRSVVTAVHGHHGRPNGLKSKSNDQLPSTESAHLGSNKSDETAGRRETENCNGVGRSSHIGKSLKHVPPRHVSDIQRTDLSAEYLNDKSGLRSSENGFRADSETVRVDSNGSADVDVSFDALDLNGKEFAGPEMNVEPDGCRTVLIVGAGLSAADAILAAWKKKFSVIHAFRNPLTATKLPAVMYPEYHELYRLMQGLSTRPDYLPLPGYQVVEFSKDNTVQLTDRSGNKKHIRIFSAAILIGSQPDLFFLPKTLKNLGIDPTKPVDCKLNPIQIDPFSYKCVRGPPGLYALGPLVGDNFVRFLQGGAVAVAGHIFKDNNLHKGLK